MPTAAARSRRLLPPTVPDLIMLAYTMAAQAISPFVPLHAQQLGMDNRSVGLLLAFPGLGALIASLVAGRWLARAGARSLIVGAALTAAVALVAVWAWASVTVFGVFITLFWAVQPLVAIAVQVLVVTRSASVGRDRAVGMHSFYMSLGVSLGPLLGAAVVAATSAINTVFLAAAVVGGAAAALAAWTADEGKAPAVRTPPFLAGLRAVPVTVRISIYLVMIAEFCYVAWATFFPLALKDTGHTPQTIGVVFALYGVAISVVRTAMAWLVQRVGRLGVLVASFAFLSVGLWCSLVTTALPLTLAAALLLGLGGLTFPITIVLVSAPVSSDALGRVLAVRFLAITVGQMLGPAIAGVLAGYSVSAALAGVAGLATVTTLWVVWVRRQVGDTFLDTPKSAMLG